MAPDSKDSELTSPNEDLHIPKWINEDYFRHIIERELPDAVGIRKFTPIAATLPGENYTSVMVRVHVEVELRGGSIVTRSYILKTMLEAADSAEVVNSMGLFPKEQQMYQVLMPAFEKLYKAAGAQVQLSPRCLHVDATPERTTLIMEDLGQRRFRNVDRLQGFDMPHMRAVLHKLAELHAASAVYYELNGPYDPLFDYGLMSAANRKFFDTIETARLPQFLTALQQWDLDKPDYYASKIMSPAQKCDEFMRISKADPAEFNVLNHGDCWSNNVMFQHAENGDVQHTLLVDLQISEWGSPTHDLWYLITTSAALDIKVKEFDHFIKIYHDHLVHCLKLLKYEKPIPSLKELHALMIKYSFWAFTTATCIMVVTLLPTDKDASIEEMLKTGPEGEEFRLKSFLNPYYAKAMSQLLPFLDNKGGLEIEKTTH